MQAVDPISEVVTLMLSCFQACQYMFVSGKRIPQRFDIAREQRGVTLNQPLTTCSAGMSKAHKCVCRFQVSERQIALYLRAPRYYV